LNQIWNQVYSDWYNSSGIAFYTVGQPTQDGGVRAVSQSVSRSLAETKAIARSFSETLASQPRMAAFARSVSQSVARSLFLLRDIWPANPGWRRSRGQSVSQSLARYSFSETFGQPTQDGGVRAVSGSLDETEAIARSFSETLASQPRFAAFARGKFGALKNSESLMERKGWK
jgi:hypothetical protein